MKRHPLTTATVGRCSLHDQGNKTNQTPITLSIYDHTFSNYVKRTRGTKLRQAIKFAKYLDKCTKLFNDAQSVTIRKKMT